MPQNAFPSGTSDVILCRQRQYVKTLKSMLPDSKISIMSLRGNLGYAAATNMGIQEAENRFVCMLNPDTAVFAGWVNRLIRPLWSVNRDHLR